MLVLARATCIGAPSLFFVIEKRLEQLEKSALAPLHGIPARQCFLVHANLTRRLFLR
jgi:hypothetical protein